MLEIEIVDIEPIEGGVQIFARAWNDGVQIGFGNDGTVDIERFRIFNPPILVPDENRDIVIEQQADDSQGLPYSRRVFREDPQEALLQSLENTIVSMKNVHDADVIVPNKRGNTTSTFYSSENDGTFLSDNKATYALARDATSAGAIDQGNGNVVHNSLISTTYYVRRYITYFDTSSIPDTDTISSATFSVASLAASVSVNSDSIELVEFTGSNPPVVGDFDLFGSTSWGTKTLASFSSTAGVFNDITLNGTGIAAINKTGTTPVGIRTINDINNVTPTGNNYMRIYVANESGTSLDPKLVVEHAAPSTSITVNPVAQSITASIPAYSVKKGVTQSPAAQALTASIPAYTVRLPKTVSVSPQSIVASIPAYTVDAGGNVSVAVAAQSFTLSVPAYAILLDTVFSPSPQTLTLSTPAASISLGTGVTVSPEAQTATLSIATPVITAQRSIIISVATQILTLSLPTLAKVGGVWTKRARQTDSDWGVRSRQTDSDWSRTPANDT